MQISFGYLSQVAANWPFLTSSLHFSTAIRECRIYRIIHLDDDNDDDDDDDDGFFCSFARAVAEGSKIHSPPALSFPFFL